MRLVQGNTDCGHCTIDFTIQGIKVGDADGEWSEIYSHWQKAELPLTTIAMSIVDEVCMPSCPAGATTLSPAYTSVRLVSPDSVSDNEAPDEALVRHSQQPLFVLWRVSNSNWCCNSFVCCMKVVR